MSLAVLIILMLAGPSAHAQLGTRDQPVWIDLPDSLTTVVLDSTANVGIPAFDIRGRRVRQSTAPGTTRIGSALLESAGARSVADLGKMLPSTRMSTNSRGEALFMIRGASERHIGVLLDGIPMTIPWDERADLSLIPLDGIGSVKIFRGISTVLAPPNAVAGHVHLIPRELDTDGLRSELSSRGGSAGLFETALRHQGRRGPWSWLGVISHRQRDAFLLSEDTGPLLHQEDDSRRTGSDFRQNTFLMRLRRQLAREGHLHFLLAGHDGKKGVAPEGHLEDARFWRYPLHRRLIAATDLAWIPDNSGKWRMEGAFSADFFGQEIREYSDDHYASPPLQDGIDYETDRDRTFYSRARVLRSFEGEQEIALQATARHTQHEESLVYSGPEESYSQWIRTLAGQWKGNTPLVDVVQIGVGIEQARTPLSGPMDRWDAATEGSYQLSLSHWIHPRTQLQLAAGQRSRFPSLRELYSGALGKFLPNPDLKPERLRSAELGALIQHRRWDLSLVSFGHWLADGIEKRVLPEHPEQYERVNVESIRTLGLESILTWRIGAGLTFRGQHSLLHTRKLEDGDYTAWAEDRPSYLSSFSLSLARPSGLRLTLEGVFTGKRQSADSADEIDGLRLLEDEQVWNLRLAYRHYGRWWMLENPECFLRVDNILDRLCWSQAGLPGAGRMLILGLSLAHGS